MGRWAMHRVSGEVQRSRLEAGNKSKHALTCDVTSRKIFLILPVYVFLYILSPIVFIYNLVTSCYLVTEQVRGCFWGNKTVTSCIDAGKAVTRPNDTLAIA